MNESVKQKIVELPKTRECITIIDNETNTPLAYVKKHHENVLGGKWVATFQSGMEWLASQESMTGEQWRVFAYLISRLDFDNYLRVPQADIAEHLKMQKSHVSRAIKGLVTLDVILPGPMAGRYKTYRLNPRIAHRGAKNYKSTLIAYDELKKRREEKEENNHGMDE